MGREQEEAARDAAALELENTLLAKAASDSSFATAYALLRLARMTERVALAIDGGTFDLSTCIKDNADHIAEVFRNGIRVHSGEED